MASASSVNVNRPHVKRVRYFLDLILFIAAAEGLAFGLNRLPWPGDERLSVLLSLATKIPVVLVACLLLRLRGEKVSDLGLRRPGNWGRTVLVGLGVAAGIFAIVAMLEAAGWRRNLSSFKALEDNLPLTLLNILNGIIGAGLFEEFIFRGFLFYGLAMAFGGNRVAWMAAALIQSVLFGLAHGYQGALGTVITGTIGLLLAFVYMCTGRNLWAPIIAHAAYDTARAVLFYFQGPPCG